MRYLSKATRPAAALLGLALLTASFAQSFAQSAIPPYRLLHPTPLTSVTGPQINTVAGNGNSGYVGSGVPALQAELNQPSAVILDKAGNFYFADTRNQRIRKVSTSGVITTYAGNGSQGYAGDGDQADAASLNDPVAIAFDAAGNLYIADRGNSAIRKVTPAGIISTVAGSASMGAGFSGDTGPATAAQLWNPSGVAVDSLGDIFIADTFNCVIRMVNTKGIIATYAGVAPPSSKNWDGECRYFNASGGGVVNGGYNGDGPATTAQLYLPQGIALDPAGDLYIADTANSLVRMVTKATANLTTVAGSFPSGYTGDGGPALAAALNNPEGVALDSSGNFYIADSYNNVIREVTASTGYINTVAGNGTAGFTGDAGPATSAELYDPEGVAVDPSGDIYIADTDNNRIREVGAVTPTAAAPGFSQPSGTYSAPLEITLSDAPGVSIFYTTNGTNPATVVGNGTSLYAGTPIPVDALGTTTIKAIATAKGFNPSGVVSATYTLVTQVLQPKVSPATGAYSYAQTVQITDATPGAVIHYTVNGTVPTASSPVYTAPFIVASNLTVQAIAVAAGDATSPLIWTDYVFVGTPSILAYPATAISTPDATLNAVVNTLGIAGTYYFQYGTTSTALTLKSPVKSLAASANPVLATTTIAGLVSKTTYYYQIVVTTKSGTSTGEILSFTAN